MRQFLLVVPLVFYINDALGSYLPLDKKIVGGSLVAIEEHPYQVAVIQDDELWCGGSIVALNFVLLAGHCVFNAFSPLTVHAGSAYWSRPGSVHHVDYNITYTPMISLTADVALLHVIEPFIYDTTRQPIPLFDSNELPEVGAQASVTGWGFTQDGSESEKLTKVTVVIVDPKLCNDIYEGTLVGPIVPGELCANSNGRGPCRGDSGGPLVVEGRQVGIVSLGMNCEYRKYPAVYASVPYFRNWITAQVKIRQPKNIPRKQLIVLN